MGTAASLAVTVFPTAREFGASLQKQVIGPATEVGARTGKSFSDAFTAEAAKAGLGADSAIASSARESQLAIESAAVKVVAARGREADAAGQVRVAEQKLAEARAKYAADSSQVLAAEERLATAQRNVELRSDSTVLATEKLSATRVSAAEAAGKSAVASDAESASLGKVKALAEDTSSTLGGLMAQYSKMGALVAAAVVIGMGVKGVQAAGQFQQSQERLVTTAGELQKNLGLISQGILTMAGQVGISAQDLSTGMYTVESAGYHVGDALAVLRASAQGAKEENADLSTVTNAVTSALRDYHLPASDAALVTSKLITAVSDGKTNFQDLTGAMSAVLPVASAAHIGMAEILGDLSSMTLHGESADQSAQNLANAVRGLANPTLAATKELAALGINSADLSKNLGKTGVSGAMEEIVTAILQHMGPAGTTLLNAFNQSKQAASDANQMFKALPPSLQDMAKKMENGQISMHDWTLGLRNVSPLQANLLNQWLAGEKRASGFSDALKTGGNASQTFTQALAKATGNSTSMNVALMLTGENAAKTQQNIADVAKATTEAGGNTRGWSDIQGTLNQRIAEIRSGIGAWVIEMGQKLIPVIMGALNFTGRMISAFKDLVSWLKENRTWIGLVAVVVGTLVAPLVAVRIATLATQAAMLAWRAVQIVLMNVRVAIWLVNAAIAANPVMIIVTAIAALIAGLVYAYFHFKAFRDIIDEIGRVLRAAFLAAIHAVGDAARWLIDQWNRFAQAVMPIVRTVGGVFVWLYDHAVKPAFDGIANAVRTVVGAVVSWWHTLTAPIIGEWNVITGKLRAIWGELVQLWNATGGRLVSFIADHMKLIHAVIMIEWNAISDYFRRLWGVIQAIVRVAWTVISDIVSVAWSVIRGIVMTAVSTVVGAVRIGWAILAGIFRIAWDIILTIVRVAWNVIAAIFWAAFDIVKGIVQVAWDIIVGIFRIAWTIVTSVINTALDIIKGIIKIFVDIFTGQWGKLWTDTKQFVMTILTDIWTFITRIFSTIWDTISGVMRSIFGTMSGIWTDVKNTTLAVLGDLWSGIKAGFQDAVNVIGTILTGLEKAFGTPIEFVIRTILNNGIIKGLNYILGVVNLKIPNIPDPGLPTFAAGGVVPGTGPVDSVHALVSPGEGILVPAAVIALGGAAGINAINAAFGGGRGPTLGASGLPGFGVGGFVSGILGDIGKGLTDAWNGVKNAALGGLRTAASAFFDNVVKPLVGEIPGGNTLPRQMLNGLVNKVESDVLDFLGQKDKSASAAAGAGSIGGAIPTGNRLAILTQALTADAIPQAQWGLWEAGLNTLIARESNWNPTAVNNWDSNAKAGHPSTGLGQTIKSTFEAYRNPQFPDDMTNPVANVAAVIKYIIARYGSITNVQQANANLPPKGYDDGGYLPVGVSLAVNRTRRPEPVLTGDQWDDVRRAGRGGDGGSQHHYHITSTEPLSVAHEVERRERARMRQRL